MSTPSRKLQHALVLLAAAVALVAGLATAVVRLIVPVAPPRELPVPPALGPPLTTHLALVIIDGVRYDTATDPARMPHLAALMRERTSGEIWAGPVSMTSSAILTYATGQRGDLDQIVNNESGTRVAYNSLLGNARAAGLRTAGTGDRAWFRMFPDAFTASHPDPSGVAIDLDYNAEIFAAAYELLRAQPNLLVVHFVTPDHQAHAYGSLSERYRAHIRGFDAELAKLLAALPATYTVFVTSDHGATDTGTHGSDTPVQRRSPIVAWGPGLVADRHEGRALDQIDLPSTFAALLGVAAPAHGRGHVLVDWLDAPDERRAAIACADLERLVTYGRTVLGDAVAATGAPTACAAATPRGRIEAAARAAAAMDRAIGGASLAGSPHGWLVPALAIGGALVLGLWALGRRVLRHGREVAVGAALTLVLIGGGVACAYGIELLPGRWPDAVRGVLFACANLALLVFVLRPRTAAGLLDRRIAAGAAVLPGLLAVSYTKTTQAQAFVVAAALTGVALTVGLPPVAERARIAGRVPRLVVIGALLALLSPLLWRDQGCLPTPLTRTADSAAWTAWVSIGIFAAARAARVAWSRSTDASRRRLVIVETAAGAAIAIASLALRRVLPAEACIALWIGLLPVAVVVWRKGRRELAELVALGSYAWVAREPEIPILLATYAVALAVGEAFGAAASRADERGDGDGVPRPSLVLAAVAFLFAWTYVQRIGVQLGLGFETFDWGAGAFRQPGVSLLRIGAAISYKHAFARGAVLFAVLLPMRPRYRSWIVRGLVAVELCRVATLTTMLYVCRGSFWTSLRVMADVPHALGAVVVASVAYLVVAASGLRQNDRDGGRQAAPARDPVVSMGGRLADPGEPV